MANYQFSADLVNDVLFRAGEPTDGTSDFENAALQYVNRAYQAIWLGGSELSPEINENWWWLLTEASFKMNPKITTGTVSVTNNSATITFSSAPAASVAGYHFLVTGVTETYKISAHTGGSATATIDLAYVGTTNASASYTLLQVDYNLASDVLRLANPMRLTTANLAGSAYSRPGRKYQVLGLTNRQLEETSPLAEVSEAVPRFFAQMDEDTVRFNSYPASAIRVDYLYLRRPADLTDSTTEEPAIPRQYRRLIADAALMFLFIDKNDDRTALMVQVVQQGIRAMAAENHAKLQVYGERVNGLSPAPIVNIIPHNPESPLSMAKAPAAPR